jgi:antitoxin component YwqK of YwqJK toxin-antitoxin module
MRSKSEGGRQALDVSGNLMTTFKLTIFLTIISLFSCKTGNNKIIFKWGNGKTKLERIYSDTPRIYLQKEYYENGQLASETRFIDSTENGESVAYYKNGQLLGMCIYRNGKINGKVSEFHKNGSPMFKGTQVDGQLVGTATHFYDNGKPETELYYKDNKVFLVNYWDSSGIQQITNGDGIMKFQDYLLKDKNGSDTTINVRVVGMYKDSLHNGLWKYYNLAGNKLILERHFKDDKVISDTWK